MLTNLRIIPRGKGDRTRATLTGNLTARPRWEGRSLATSRHPLFSVFRQLHRDPLILKVQLCLSRDSPPEGSSSCVPDA